MCKCVTLHVQVCIMSTAHIMIFLKGIMLHTPESLRIWMTGLQSCEQLSNPSIYDPYVLKKIHKLQFLSSSESDETIVFPRVKRRLQQLKEETAETLSVLTIDAITCAVQKAKMDAQEVCTSSGIHLESYADKDLISNVEKIVEDTIVNDQEEEEGNSAISKSTECNSSCSV